MQSGRRLISVVAAAVGLVLTLAFALREGAGDAREGMIVVIPHAHRAAAPATPADGDSPIIAASEIPASGIEQLHADVALLDTRFASARAEPERDYRAERLKARVGRIMIGGVGFGALEAECRRNLCRLSGAVVDGAAAADRATAFALLHQAELVAIAAAEGLEPGPLTTATTPAGETRFVAYLVTP